MAYSYALHNNPPIYSALKKINLSVNTVFFSCFAGSLLSIAPWKVSAYLSEPATEMLSQLQR